MRLPPSAAAALALVLVATPRAAVADPPPAPPPLAGAEVLDEEKRVAVAAASALVRIAMASADAAPADSACDRFGVQVATDGLVLTTASWLVAHSLDRDRRALWVRRADRPWERAIPVARSPWGDLGLVRVLGGKAAGTALAPGGSARTDRGLLVRLAPDGRALVDVALRRTTWWTDPSLGGDRLVTERERMGTSPSARAVPYRTTWSGVRGSDAEGAAILDVRGAFAGFVTGAEAADRVELAATPSEYVRLFLAICAREGSFRPADFGVKFGPTAAELAQGTIPKDLLDVRASGKLRGGALVTDVSPKGPSAEILWPGDVVVELAGRPVSSTVPESFLVALADATPGEKTPVAVWRGGKKEVLFVTPRTADSEAR